MAVTHGHGNPDWTREETILALGLYFEMDGVIPSSDDGRIQALSATLRKFPYHATASRKESFRNPDGVAFKLQNLRQVATGKGLGNVSKMDRVIWAEFGSSPEMVRLAAARILEAVKSIETLAALEDDLDEFAEGRIVTELHIRRERDGRLRERLLLQLKKAGPLRCEMCDVTAMSLGASFEDAIFEAHHKLPLSSTGPRITRLSDVALLCANCHRVIHRAISDGKRWISVESARDLLRLKSAT